MAWEDYIKKVMSPSSNWWDKGLTDTQRFRLQAPQNPSLLDVVSMTPTPVGDVASGLLAAQDLSNGNYGSAALNAVGLVPFVPSMGGIVKNTGINQITSWYPTKKLPSHPDDVIPRATNLELFNEKIPSEYAKTAGIFFPDTAGTGWISPTTKGDYVAGFYPSWGSNLKEFSARAANPHDLVSYVTSRAENQYTKNIIRKKHTFDNSLVGKLKSSIGDDFTAFNSARSESKYLIHEPTGSKIRISGHELPSHYEPADLDIPNWLNDKEKIDFITRFSLARKADDYDGIDSIQQEINKIKK